MAYGGFTSAKLRLANLTSTRDAATKESMKDPQSLEDDDEAEEANRLSSSALLILSSSWAFASESIQRPSGKASQRSQNRGSSSKGSVWVAVFFVATPFPVRGLSFFERRPAAAELNRQEKAKSKKTTRIMILRLVPNF